MVSSEVKLRQPHFSGTIRQTEAILPRTEIEEPGSSGRPVKVPRKLDHVSNRGWDTARCIASLRVSPTALEKKVGSHEPEPRTES